MFESNKWSIPAANTFGPLDESKIKPFWEENSFEIDKNIYVLL